MFPKRRNYWVSDTGIFNFGRFEALSPKSRVSESRIIARIFECQFFLKILAKINLAPVEL